MYSRKIKLIALFTVLAAVVIYGWRNDWFGTGGISGGEWNAVPENSCMVVDVPAWGALQSKLDTLPYGEAFGEALLNNKINLILAELHRLSSGKEDLTSQHFLASYHMAKVGQLDILMILKDENLGKACKKKLKKDKYGTFTSYQYKRKAIYQSMDSLGNKLTITFINDLVMASYTSFLVEDALAQLIVGSNLVADARDRLASVKNDEKALKILFYYPNTSLWLGAFLPAQEVKQKGSWSTFATASLLDLELLPGSIMASGKTLISDGDLLQHFNTPSTLPSLPPLTHSIYPFTFKSSPSSRVERLLSRWFTGNGWKVNMPNISTSGDQQMLWLKSSGDIKKVDTLLNYLGVKLPETSSPVSMLKIPAGWQKKVLSKSYYKSDSLWMLIVDSSLVAISANEVSLATLKWVMQEKEGLLHATVLPGESVYNMYYGSWLPSSAELKNDTKTPITNLYAPLQALLQNLSISIDAAGNGISETTISIDITSKRNDTTAIPWWTAEANIDLIKGPYIVQDSGSLAWIITQDSLKNAYCWDIDGKLLWKQPLDGIITGHAFALDYYGNKQMQVMFCTAKTVYCFNNKGSQVGGYPLKFASSAATITHTGHDANGKFYITTTGGDIYGFEINGRPIQGLSPLKAFAKPEPIAVDASSGVLVTVLKDGSVKAWKRDGKPLWVTKQPIKQNTIPVMTDRDSLGLGWIYLMANGDLAYVASDGKVSTSKFANSSNAGLYNDATGWSFQKDVFNYYNRLGALLFSVNMPANTIVKSSGRSGNMVHVETDHRSYWINMDTKQLIKASTVSTLTSPVFFYLPGAKVYGNAAIVDGKKLRVWILPEK